MPTKTIAGKVVQVNDEGFMTDPNEWDKDIAAGDRPGGGDRGAWPRLTGR